MSIVISRNVSYTIFSCVCKRFKTHLDLHVVMHMFCWSSRSRSNTHHVSRSDPERDIWHDTF